MSEFRAKTGLVRSILTGGVIIYEGLTDNWDAHTFVNVSFLVGGTTATMVGAPVVVAGIALYGIGDYIFDFSEKINSTVGRKTSIW